MKNFVEWIKNLSPEFIIIFIILIIVLILIFTVIGIVNNIKKKITFVEFKLSEDLVYINNQLMLRLNITNASFSMGVVREYGIMHNKNKMPISDEKITLSEREHILKTLEIDEVRNMISNDKIKVYLYVIDSLNNVQKLKLRLTNKHIKSLIKNEKKKAKQDAKMERIKTGNYNFKERVVLILKLIVSPIVKLSKIIKNKINNYFHNKRLKREEKQLNDIVENKELSSLNNDTDDFLREEKVIVEDDLITNDSIEDKENNIANDDEIDSNEDDE